ncbi:MAG: hypothetical protein ABFS42_06280, partial [Candidatus Krumholzibacteriota bacterium]
MNTMLRVSTTIILFISLTQSVLAESCRDYLPPPETSYGYSLGGGHYHAIASRGSYAYACIKDSDPNPKIVCYGLGPNISQAPTIQDWLTLPATASRIVLVNDHAILALGYSGLGVVDISTPNQLPSLSLTATTDVCKDAALLGTTHLVTAEWSALRVYGLQDPTAPVEIAAATLSQARSVAVAGDLAFVACGSLGLAIVDVSNPVMPSLVIQFPVGGFVDQVAVEGDRVYLTGYLVGLVTVDVTTPSSPSVVGTLPLTGEAEAIVIRGGYAYLSVGEAIEMSPGSPYFDGMALVRLNNPGSPMMVDYYFPTQNYSAIGLGDDRVLLGEFEAVSHLNMAPLQCPEVSDVPGPIPTDLSLSDPWPNPFNPRVSVRFDLPEGRPGRLVVHD